jgi:hypothetical protein
MPRRRDSELLKSAASHTRAVHLPARAGADAAGRGRPLLERRGLARARVRRAPPGRRRRRPDHPAYRPTARSGRPRAAYVVAADGGSSPTRGHLNVGVRGALLQGPLGRHRHEGHQALALARSTGSGSIATRPARRWTAPLRWATTAGSSRCSRGEHADALVILQGVLELLAGQGIGPNTSRYCVQSSTTTTSASPTAGGSGVPGRRRRA